MLLSNESNNNNNKIKTATDRCVEKEANSKQAAISHAKLKAVKAPQRGSNSIRLYQTLPNELAKGKQTRLCLVEQRATAH